MNYGESTKGEFYNDLSEIDEVWFVFDTEPDLRGKWEEYYSIIQNVHEGINYLLSLRKYNGDEIKKV